MSDNNTAQMMPVMTNVKQRIYYGLGDTGYNFLFEMGQLYLLKYYTDHLQLPGYVAGLIFLLVKIWDAFADISVGTWIDSRMNIGKRGKFRPFMLYSAIPLALLLVASFAIPEFSMTWKVVFAFLTYMIFGTVYSIGNIAYGSIIPAVTKNTQERSILASFRQAGSNLGLLISTVAFMPIVWFFSDERLGYTFATVVFGVCGVILILLSYSHIQENYIVKPKEKVSFEHMKAAYKALFRNNALIVLCIVNIFTFSAFNVKLAVQVYFAQYILNDANSVMSMGFFSIGAVFIGTIIVPQLVKRMDKVWVYIVGGVIWAIADLMAYFVVDDILSYICFASLAFLGSSFINTLNWALISDAVEYGEWKTNIRSEGLVYSAYTFFRKLSTAIAGFVPGVVLTLVGYVPNAQQTDEAINGIRGLIFLYPGALSILTILVMYFAYPIWNKEYKKIISELTARHAQAEKS